MSAITTQVQPKPRFQAVIPFAWLAVLWAGSITTSIVSFHRQYQSYPTQTDVVIGATLLAPFAIPKAFGDVVGFTNRGSTRGTLLTLACFWPITLTLAGCVLALRSKLAFAALSIVMITASLEWQIVANGLIGL